MPVKEQDSSITPPHCKRRACPRPECRAYKLRQVKRSKARRHAAGHSLRAAPPDLTARAAEHLDTLMREPGASLGAVARAAGISRDPITRLLSGLPPSPAAAQAILATTLPRVRQAIALVPAETTRQRVGALQASGYPVAWQARIAGLTDRMLQPARHVEVTAASTVAAVADLYEKYRDRLAGDEDGIPAGTRKHVMTRAASMGLVSALYCDDDGNPIYSTVPGHPWEVADRTCRVRVGMVAEIVWGASARMAAQASARAAGATESDPKAWATAVSTWERYVARAVRDLQIGGMDRTLPRGDRRVPPRLQHLRDRIEAYRAEGVDAVTLLLELGIEGSSVIPADHPARAARTEEQRQDSSVAA